MGRVQSLRGSLRVFSNAEQVISCLIFGAQHGGIRTTRCFCSCPVVCLWFLSIFQVWTSSFPWIHWPALFLLILILLLWVSFCGLMLRSLTDTSPNVNCTQIHPSNVLLIQPYKNLRKHKILIHRTASVTKGLNLVWTEFYCWLLPIPISLSCP